MNIKDVTKQCWHCSELYFADVKETPICQECLDHGIEFVVTEWEVMTFLPQDPNTSPF